MYPLPSRRTLPLLLALGALSLLFPAPALHAKTGSNAASAPIDVNFFYDTLKDDGSWYNTTEYGDVWQPYIAYKSDTWRPYTDGYWSYTDGGWMFVSNEDFGWAVYHYGRWTRLKDIGWAWVPGTDWAPAWVTWRASKADGNGPPANPDGSAPTAPANAAAIDANSTAPATAADDKNPPPDASSSAPSTPRAPAREESAGGPPPSEDYIGWAPLPPEPRAYTELDYSYGPTVDVDFEIDPYDYCFTDVRSFGAPYVAAVIFDPGRNYYCADRSVNITNIYYNHNGPYRGFYAGGPDYNRFRGVTRRPIPQYDLRPSSGSAARDAIRRGQFTRVNGKTLAVPAPQFARTSVGPDGRVKLTRAGALAKAQVNRGAPSTAADNPAYKQARESFTKQGETYRSQHPGAPGTRAAALQAVRQNESKPETAPKIVTTPRAQQEERDARRAAGEKNVPPPETRQEALKERSAGASEPHPEGQKNEPKPDAAHSETAAAPAAGETHRSRREARRDAARQAAASHPTEAAAPQAAAREQRRQERHQEPVRREHAPESGGRSHAPAAPRVESHNAPKPAPAPKPQGGGGGGGGGGGEKKDDKKKK